MNEVHNVIGGRGTHAFSSAARVLLGLFVLIVGVMKFIVPEFRVAFMGQVNAAGIPLQAQSLVLIPMVEAVVGAMLIGGVMTRLASFVAMLVMALGTYLHLVVPEPSLYPLQFGLPLIPAVGLVLAAFLYFVDSYGDHV